MLKISPRPRLIAGLVLSPLVLGGCVSQSAYDQLQAENRQLQSQNQQLRQQVAARQEQVSRLQGAIAYTVNTDLLFNPGSWQMTKRGENIIADFAKKLAAEQQSKLVVNGYTDDKPIGPELKRQGIASNQELSQKRAEEVMRYMISQGVNPDMIQARGYGDANPIAPNDTPQGRAKNRRVEVTTAS
ncbi:OmpA family protein [Azospirillum rugosum]|uniref:Chemotaxis protein MotB n=1 Tax=Azospirillum rugosum TaxID=416170 RepID=A0ABS4SXT0_9PROT|nr:OmpA family protein [Azospirillum rugosum]MBP2296782.1 chemotaxis protein MotB [Azospirillum rugosum]MDQ0530385.1 chemotaxis protein MotB [Azospirillum rugosum]